MAGTSHEKTLLWRISGFHFAVWIRRLGLRNERLVELSSLFFAWVCFTSLHGGFSFLGRKEERTPGHPFDWMPKFFVLVADHNSIDFRKQAGAGVQDKTSYSKSWIQRRVDRFRAPWFESQANSKNMVRVKPTWTVRQKSKRPFRRAEISLSIIGKVEFTS